MNDDHIYWNHAHHLVIKKVLFHRTQKVVLIDSNRSESERFFFGELKEFETKFNREGLDDFQLRARFPKFENE